MSSALWWQGESGINYRVDLDEYATVSRLVEADDERALVSSSWTGRTQTIVQHVRRIVRIEINEISAAGDPETIALLRNFGEHYRRGGSFAFAAEQSRAWLSYLTIPLTPSRTAITTGTCVGWAAGSAEISIGDEMTISQGYPLKRTHGIASAPTASSGFNVFWDTPGVFLSCDVGAALHARDYYPALTRTAQNAGVRETNDRGVTYSFAFDAQESLPLLLSGAALWQSMTLSTTSVAPPGKRLEDAINPTPGGMLSPFNMPRSFR